MLRDPGYAERRRAQKREQSRRAQERGVDAAARARRKTAGTTYFTGRPCKRGHVAARYATSQTCVECMVEHQRRAEALRAERMLVDPEFYKKRRTQKNRTSLRWRKKNPGLKVAETAAYRLKLTRRVPCWMIKFEREQIRELYKIAARLTRASGVQWHVDHEVPLNGDTVSGLHVLGNLRVVRWRDNLLKGNRFDDESDRPSNRLIR